LLSALLSSGCAAVVVSGASGGIAYTITNIAYKTVTFPLNKTEAATYAALKKMGIKAYAKEYIDNGVKIISKTEDLDIDISLERVTTKSTKISVDARKNVVIKDKATATEIISQIEKILDGKNNKN
jgi:dihydrodipicolinate reductase